MIFRQVTHDDLGCASYLIGDEDAGVAAVVDPRFEVDEYLELARYMGVSIEHVLETHNHADHVSGHGRLAAATGATIHIHRLAEPDYEHEPFDDGWELELGALRVRALHTPGHRPEHTAFALVDTARSERPWAVLTGDTLFVNDVARPDLAIEKAEGARGIFRSLRDKLLDAAARVRGVARAPRRLDVRRPGDGHEDLLDDRLRARGATRRWRSRTRTRSSSRRSPGSGRSRRTSRTIVALNRGELLTDGVEVLPLAPRQVEQRRAAGALLVDVRTDQQFDDAHIPGAVCNPMLTAGFGSKLAWIGDPRARARVRGPRRRGRAARGAARAVGRAAAARRLPARRDDELAAGEARRSSASSGCRSRSCPSTPSASRSSTSASAREWDAGHIPGSAFTPWHDIDGAARRARPGAADRGHVRAPASAPRSRRASCCARARAR